MKFGFREKIIAAAALLALLVVAWYMLYYSPKKDEIADVNAEIRRIQRDINSLTVSDALLDSLREEIRTLQESARTSINLSVPEDSIMYIRTILEQSIGGHNLKITRRIETNIESLFPDTNVPPDTSTLEYKTGIRPIDMDLSLSGTFRNLVHFLESFEDFPFLVRAGEIDINTDDDLYPELLINLKIYVFLETN